MSIRTHRLILFSFKRTNELGMSRLKIRFGISELRPSGHAFAAYLTITPAFPIGILILQLRMTRLSPPILKNSQVRSVLLIRRRNE